MLVSALASLALAVSAGSAQADAVAGWDFSQYFGSGFLTTNGATFVDTLDANYSDFDPTFNAGAESAQFGTMYMNGTNGSDQVPGLGTGTETFVPLSGSLMNNVNPFLGGTGNPFNSFTILQDEGQAFASDLRMQATGAIAVVFEADVSTIGAGENWELQLAGIVDSGASQVVGVEYSANGVNYTPAGNLALTDVDSLFTLPLGIGSSAQQFVRLSFDPASGTGIPVIDNLSIMAVVTSVPEPGTALLGMVGITGLAFLGRRRS
jgi:hypothetical protein